MSILGHIDDMPLADVLQMVSAGKGSGVLTLVCREGTGRMLLNRGRVIFAGSDVRKRLGALLVERGLVSFQDLNLALKQQKTEREARPVGTILVENGVIRRDQLEAVLRPHMIAVFSDFLRWKKGIFYFEKNWLLASEMVGQEGIKVESILLEAARLSDEIEEVKTTDEVPELWP